MDGQQKSWKFFSKIEKNFQYLSSKVGNFETHLEKVGKKVGNFEKDNTHVISIIGIHFMENKIAASSSHLNVINGIGFQTVHYCFGPSRKIAEHH